METHHKTTLYRYESNYKRAWKANKNECLEEEKTQQNKKKPKTAFFNSSAAAAAADDAAATER